MDVARWLEAGEPQTSLRLGGRRGVAVLVVLALVAVWSGHQAAAFLVIALLALAATARWWANHALERVECRYDLSEDRAFPGDSLRVRLLAVNRKALPLAWLRVRSAVPPALTPADAPRRWPGLERGGYLQGLAALPWYSQAAWEFDLACRARGVYLLGPLELVAGDPFGLYVQRDVRWQNQAILVYPRIVPLRRLGFPLAAGLGQALRRRSLFEDSSRTAGVREYRPGDPLHRIHWKATARQGSLQVRVVEPAIAPTLSLILACDTFDFPWSRYRDDLFELAASALASIAWRALEDGWPVGLATSGPEPCRLPPACDPRQLSQVLEGLARAQPGGAVKIDQRLADQPAGPRAPTCVLAIGRPTPALLAALDRLRSRRQPVVLLYGDEAPATGGALPAYRLRQWDDLAATLEGPGEVVGGR